MRKIVLALLLGIFISGFIGNLLSSERTFSNYFLFFIGFGIIVIYVLNKVLTQRLLTYIQLALIGLNILSIIGLYLYGFITSSDSFGLGLMVIMMFTLLIAQITVFIVYIGLNKLKTYDNQEQIENGIIIGYTFINFITNQVNIPNNYDIPFSTGILAFTIVFLIFGGLSLLMIKVFKKDIDIPLLISLIGLLIVINSGLDVNIFLRLPLQITVITFLMIKFIPLNFKSYNINPKTKV
jgi:hypothetical protein